jgi:hypothetical protein
VRHFIIGSNWSVIDMKSPNLSMFQHNPLRFFPLTCRCHLMIIAVFAKIMATRLDGGDNIAWQTELCRCPHEYDRTRSPAHAQQNLQVSRRWTKVKLLHFVDLFPVLRHYFFVWMYDAAKPRLRRSTAQTDGNWVADQSERKS